MGHVLLFVSALAMFPVTASSETVIRITNGEWEPYLSEYSYQYGFDSHVVTEAFALEGITIEWGFYPWTRAYREARLGERWDGSCCWWPAQEVKDSFLLSGEISSTSFVFFHLKSYAFDWNSLDDLKGIRIGITQEYDYGEAFLTALSENKFLVQSAHKDELNYRKLLAGRIQIFPNDPLVGQAQIRNSLSAEEANLITYHPKQFEKSTLHLILSRKMKNGRKIMNKFNSGLQKLKKSGRYSEMLKALKAGQYDKQADRWKP